MQALPSPAATVAQRRYAKCVEVSKRIRWDIDQDVIRGRGFDVAHHFLPEGLTRIAGLPGLDAAERRLLSQVQGRTYANMFGLVERYIAAKMLEVSRDHWLGDQTALEALVRFSDEELKHQALFRRLESMLADVMPAGYRFLPEPNGVASFVLGKSTWAVLALTCHIELFTLAHYRQSVEPDADLSPLFKDVLFFHCREESQHAIVDELEWRREDAKVGPEQRDRAVDDFIELVRGIDGLLAQQAAADAAYFTACCERAIPDELARDVGARLLAAYRWQYIVSGAIEPRFTDLLADMTTPLQRARIEAALAPLMHPDPAALQH